MFVGILRKFDDMVEVILPQLPRTFDDIVDPDGKAALIWILGEYGEVSENVYLFLFFLRCVNGHCLQMVEVMLMVWYNDNNFKMVEE